MKKYLLTTIFIALCFFTLPRVNAQIQTSQTYINGQTTTADNFPNGYTYTWTNTNPAIGLPATGTGNIAPFTAINNGTTPVTATIIATPQPSSFAYVCTADGNRGAVEIINIDQQIVTGGFDFAVEPADVEVNHAGTYAYVCDPITLGVYVINTSTNTISAPITLIAKPLSAVLSPDDSKLYVCDFPYLTVINTSNNSVIINKLGFDPGALAVSPDGNSLYIATTGGGADVGEVYVVNTSTYNEEDLYTAGYNPNVMSISPDGSRLYVPNDNGAFNHIDVVNPNNGQSLGTINTGQYPQRVIFSKDGTTAYVASQNQTQVTVIDPATNGFISQIPTQGQIAGLGLTTDGSELLAVNYGLNNVQVISTVTNQVTNTIKGFENPTSFGYFITPYVTCGCGPIKITITILPTPPPTIVKSDATGSISTCEGSVSVSPAIQQFSVSGTYLTGNVTATAPAGFEISLSDNIGFSNSITLIQTNGVLVNTILYVRSSATAPAGDNPGEISLVSQGATTQKVDVSENIVAMPMVNIPASQVLLNGQTTTAVNFTGTAGTYSWVNDIPGIGLPATGTGDIPAFTAINNTFGPVVATITVTPVNSVDCDGTPAKFTITANPTRVATITKKDIPNTFTPNGDSINDTWVINNITYFPNATVNIFNRWGQKLFSSIGYPLAWDGTYHGKALPTGTYYYVIDLKNGEKVIAGPVAIIR